jgi:hypothetical protein
MNASTFIYPNVTIYTPSVNVTEVGTLLLVSIGVLVIYFATICIIGLVEVSTNPKNEVSNEKETVIDKVIKIFQHGIIVYSIIMLGINSATLIKLLLFENTVSNLNGLSPSIPELLNCGSCPIGHSNYCDGLVSCCKPFDNAYVPILAMIILYGISQIMLIILGVLSLYLNIILIYKEIALKFIHVIPHYITVLLGAYLSVFILNSQCLFTDINIFNANNRQLNDMYSVFTLSFSTLIVSLGNIPIEIFKCCRRDHHCISGIKKMMSKYQLN